MFASVDPLTNICLKICLKICLRTLALLSEIIFIVRTSPIVRDVGSTVSALLAAVLDQQALDEFYDVKFFERNIQWIPAIKKLV